MIILCFLLVTHRDKYLLYTRFDERVFLYRHLTRFEIYDSIISGGFDMIYFICVLIGLIVIYVAINSKGSKKTANKASSLGCGLFVLLLFIAVVFISIVVMVITFDSVAGSIFTPSTSNSSTRSGNSSTGSTGASRGVCKSTTIVQFWGERNFPATACRNSDYSCKSYSCSEFSTNGQGQSVVIDCSCRGDNFCISIENKSTGRRQEDCDTWGKLWLGTP